MRAPHTQDRMSSSPTTAPDLRRANTEGFRTAVMEFVRLSDEVAEAGKALGASRKRLKELQGVIIDHMTQHELEACNLRDGMLLLKTNKAPAPLNKELIAEALQQEVGPAKAEALAERVDQHRGVSSVTRHSLKRTKARAGRAPPPPPAESC